MKYNTLFLLTQHIFLFLFFSNAIVQKAYAMGEELCIYPNVRNASTQTTRVDMTPKSPEVSLSQTLCTPSPTLLGEPEDPLAGIEPISDTEVEEGELCSPETPRPLATYGRPSCTPRRRLILDDDQDEDEEEVLQEVFNRRRRRNRRKCRKTGMEFKDSFITLKNIQSASWIEGAWSFSF